MVSRLIRLDLTEQENMSIFVCVETTESILVKQDASDNFPIWSVLSYLSIKMPLVAMSNCNVPRVDHSWL